MNATIKAEWIAALRSGEYDQGQEYLRAENAFCCLGVLCDLHTKAGLGTWGDEDEYFGHSDILPIEVCAWADLSGPSPEVDGVALVDLNDGLNGHEQHTFAEIADLIEAHL